MRHSSSESVLETYLASEQCRTSWELTRRTWIAYSMIDSERTNKVLSMELETEKAVRPVRKGRLQFLARLMPATDGTKVKRDLIIVHNED
jgi:hypothetical protein